MKSAELNFLLSQALVSPLGIVVSSTDPERLRSHLYNARRKQDEFDCLSFVLSPEAPTTDLWIVKRNVE